MAPWRSLVPTMEIVIDEGTDRPDGAFCARTEETNATVEPPGNAAVARTAIATAQAVAAAERIFMDGA
jgi:hypothetical protein